jgi:tellurite resistance protein
MGQTGRQMAEMIRKAIRNCEITTSEYDRIVSVAEEDGMIDAEERKLLKLLQEFVSDGTVKRVRD